VAHNVIVDTSAVGIQISDSANLVSKTTKSWVYNNTIVRNTAGIRIGAQNDPLDEIIVRGNLTIGTSSSGSPDGITIDDGVQPFMDVGDNVIMSAATAASFGMTESSWYKPSTFVSGLSQQSDDLSHLTFNAFDTAVTFDREARTGDWDIGAYEIESGSIDTPDAPSGLTATAVSTTQINLAWTDVSNDTGYRVERKTGLGGTYAEIATTSNSEVSYSSTGLTDSTTYYYRVRAYNAAGNSSYSNEANATTLTPSEPPPPAEQTVINGKGKGKRNRR
jgi:hypothetical protein